MKSQYIPRRLVRFASLPTLHIRFRTTPGVYSSELARSTKKYLDLSLLPLLKYNIFARSLLFALQAISFNPPSLRFYRHSFTSRMPSGPRNRRHALSFVVGSVQPRCTPIRIVRSYQHPHVSTALHANLPVHLRARCADTPARLNCAACKPLPPRSRAGCADTSARLNFSEYISPPPRGRARRTSCVARRDL